ncbi:MAG: superoxide dismutase family protein [Phycisphaera sp.]|nr:superoxide dismutase family protein [Phycisphaera sp.]
MTRYPIMQNIKTSGVALLALTLCFLGTACASQKCDMCMMGGDGAAAVNHAVAIVTPTKGNTCRGVVKFEQVADGVKVTADIEGLTPNSKHGFHIHEFGDATSDDGTAMGGHYNPEGHEHGLPDGKPIHAGDMGNLEANAQGVAHLETVFHNITISGKNAILGRGLIVHAKVDDGGQPTGNAGARIGQGVIGAVK